MDEFLNFAIAILMYVLAIIHLAIFENRSEQSLFSRTDFWRNIYRVKLHIYLLFPAIYFFRYLIVLKKKKFFKLFWRYMRGNSSPFCRDATFQRYLMLLLYSPYSVIYFWQTFLPIWPLMNDYFRSLQRFSWEENWIFFLFFCFAMDIFSTKISQKNIEPWN